MVTLNDTQTRYREYLEHERKLAHQTVVAYMNDIERLTSSIGNKDVETITLENVREHIREMSKSGLSPNTIRRRIHSLSTFYKWLELEGITDSLLPRKLHLPKAQKSQPTWLSDNELRRFVETPSKLQLAWWLLAWFGLRRAELLALTWEDVRLEDKVLVVRGKGEYERIMPIPDKLVSALEVERAKRAETTGRIFKMQSTSLMKHFRKHIKAANLEGLGITPHSLRHTFATMLVEQGVDSAYIQELMGHKDIKTTLVYLHLRRPKLVEAMNHHILNI